MKINIKKTGVFVLVLTGALSLCQPVLGKKVYVSENETAQEEETAQEVTDETAPPARETGGEIYYELDSAEDLFWFAEKVNSGEKTVNAVLTDDIIINSEAYDGTNGDSLTQWKPIGGYKGCFDGQNHTISGLYINDDIYSYNSGFFGTICEEGWVKNMGITDSYVRGSENVGAVCGQLQKGEISGCYNKGTVKGGSYYVGGICGESQGGTITNCYNTGEVSGFEYAGGICGNNELCGTISYCYNTGEISSSRYSGYDTGGICGYNNAIWGDTIISRCYNTGKLNGWPSTIAGICAGNNNGKLCTSNKTYKLIYENCYYLDTTAEVGTLGSEREGVESKTAEEFENGDVLRLLNEGSEEAVFVQNIGTDSSPILAVFQ